MPPASKTKAVETSNEMPADLVPSVDEQPVVGEPAANLGSEVDELSVDLVPGDAVLLPDGGEAILLGIDGSEALLRCGTVHEDPIRRPAIKIISVPAADETSRHERFRREALNRRELQLPDVPLA